MTTDPIDTEALRKLADAAQPGPWKAEESLAWGHYYTEVRPLFTVDEATDSDPAHACISHIDPPDAEFIAAARTAVPALLDENAALRARIKAVQDVLEESEARGPVGMTFNGTPFPAWISIATVRRALEG